jgi:hypothetical protein
MIILLVRRKSDGLLAINNGSVTWGAGQPYPLEQIYYAARLYNKVGCGYDAYYKRFRENPGYADMLARQTSFKDLELIRVDLEAMTLKVITSGEEIKDWKSLPRD